MKKIVFIICCLTLTPYLAAMSEAVKEKEKMFMQMDLDGDGKEEYIPAAAFDEQEFINEKRIVINEDFDNDGKDEFVRYFSDFTEGLVYYYYKGDDIEKANIPINVDIYEESSIVDTEYFVIGREKNKKLIVMIGLMAEYYGESFGAGNVILIFQFRKNSFELVDSIISAYGMNVDEGKLKSKHSHANVVLGNTVLSRNIQDKEKMNLLIRTFGYELYMIDSNGDIDRVPFPVEHFDIMAFRKKENSLDVVVMGYQREGRNVSVWNTKEGIKGEKKLLKLKRFRGAGFVDGGNDFYIIELKADRNVKHFYKLDKNKKIEHVRQEVIK